MIKKLFLLLTLCASAFVLFSCATAPSAKDANAYGIDLTPVKPLSNDALVGVASKLIPSTIQKNEAKLSTAPKDADYYELLAETGKNYVMYANAFIQHNAQMLPLDRYDEQYKEFMRAKQFYLRGRDYVLTALDFLHAGFKASLLSGDDAQVEKALLMLEEKDVEKMYWCAAGWLSAFSLDPLDTEQLQTAPLGMRIMERGTELAPNYDNGAIWDALTIYYSAAPIELGGDKEKAVFANNKAMQISNGKTIGPYITRAQSLCVPADDIDGFKEALNSALQTKKPSGTTAGVAWTISCQKAKWLLDNIEDYFLVWE